MGDFLNLRVLIVSSPFDSQHNATCIHVIFSRRGNNDFREIRDKMKLWVLRASLTQLLYIAAFALRWYHILPVVAARRLRTKGSGALEECLNLLQPRGLPITFNLHLLAFRRKSTHLLFCGLSCIFSSLDLLVGSLQPRCLLLVDELRSAVLRYKNLHIIKLIAVGSRTVLPKHGGFVPLRRWSVFPVDVCA